MHSCEQVLDLIASGHTNLQPVDGMDAALDALIATASDQNPAAATFKLGQGVWEVQSHCGLASCGVHEGFL